VTPRSAITFLWQLPGAYLPLSISKEFLFGQHRYFQSPRFIQLEPASSRPRRNGFFLLTEPLTLPPAASIRSAACSLVKEAGSGQHKGQPSKGPAAFFSVVGMIRNFSRRAQALDQLPVAEARGKKTRGCSQRHRSDPLFISLTTTTEKKAAGPFEGLTYCADRNAWLP